MHTIICELLENIATHDPLALRGHARKWRLPMLDSSARTDDSGKDGILERPHHPVDADDKAEEGGEEASLHELIVRQLPVKDAHAC